MNIAGMDVYYASDLKDYGRTEDGTPFIGEVFYVIVENVRGDRWRLQHQWDGVRVEQWEEGPMFIDTRPEVRARLDKLVANIKSGNTINMMYWHQTNPAYGSDAYLDYGQAEMLAWERASIGNEQT